MGVVKKKARGGENLESRRAGRRSDQAIAEVGDGISKRRRIVQCRFLVILSTAG